TGRVGAGVARPVAHVGAARVAVIGAGRARRDLVVRRTRRARPGAVLGQIALAAGRPADRRARLEPVGRARAAGAGAALRHVADARDRAAHRGARLENVHARVVRPRAVVGGIVVAPAALRAAGAARRRRRKDVGRAATARAGAGLVDVALAGGRPAHRAARLEGVDARVARSRAVIRRIVVARPALRGARAGRRRRLEGVDRTRAARSGAALRHVALTGGRPADGRVRLEDVDARVRGAGAMVARVVVTRTALRRAGAARRRRLEDVHRAATARPCAVLGDVALAGRAAADDRARLEDVDAGVRGARAMIGGVVVAGPALRGAGARR